MINTVDSKKVLFRLKGDMKKEFSLALMKADIGAQHALEAFVEKVLAFDKNDMQPGERKFLKMLFDRSKELQAEARL